jgi:hypothetical protein
MADVRIQIRHADAGAWTSANTVLEDGEMGCETDTGQCKVGDGIIAWSALPYVGYASDADLPNFDRDVDGGTY